jgi:hypothetical protein
MDVRVYYRKIREQELELPADTVVVVSVETPDGGKEGIKTEVSRRNAAVLLVEGRAKLANQEEAEQFRQDAQSAKAQAEEQATARRMEFTFVPANEVKKSGIRPLKA